MFCIVCQKQFKTIHSYKCHTGSNTHLKSKDEYNRNRRNNVEQNTNDFVDDFHSYISQITRYTEIGQVYKQYLSKNRFRIKGTSLNSVEEAIERLSNRIGIQKEDGKIMVKCLTQAKVVKNPVNLNLSALEHTFNIRVVERSQIRRRHEQ